MIMDSNLVFAQGLDVASAAGTSLEGDVIDLDSTGRDLLDTLSLVIQVSTAFTSGGAALVQFQLASDASAAIDTAGAATEHLRSDFFGMSDLTVGKNLVMPLPAGHSLAPYERYLGLLVVTNTATTTAGSINAFLTNDAQRWRAVADAVN